MAIFEVLCFTVWKCQDFSIIQILREINFVEFRSSKTENDSFGKLHLSKSPKIHKNHNSQPLNV